MNDSRRYCDAVCKFLQNIPLEKERFAKISSLNLFKLPLLKEKLNDKPVNCLISFWMDEIKQMNYKESRNPLANLINIWRPEICHIVTLSHD